VKRWFLPLLLLAFTGPLQAQMQLRLPVRGTSPSRQFVVYCDNSAMRMQVSSFAESVKTGLLELIAAQDSWKTPVIIQLAPPSAAMGVSAPSSVRVFEVEDGMKIQIDVAIEGDLARAQFPRQLVRALLIEITTRKPLPAGTPVPDPPAWLVDGILQEILTTQRGTDPGVFQVLLDINRPPGLRRFLDENAAGQDSASRKLHDACSLALIRLLIEMPDGRKHLGDYIREIATTSGDPLDILRRHFPGLGESEASAEKWWTLSLARLSTLDRHKGLTLEQSDSLLTAALTLSLPGKDGAEQPVAIADFAKYKKQPLHAQAVGKFNAALVNLQARTHPLLRPVVDEYTAILEHIARGTTRGLEKRIAAAEDLRKEIIQRAGAISDYLNWYEATQIKTRSDAFEGYLRMAKEAAAQPPGRHTDPIGRYLDSVEAAMGDE
jgi:hypothetical protein